MKVDVNTVASQSFVDPDVVAGLKNGSIFLIASVTIYTKPTQGYAVFVATIVDEANGPVMTSEFNIYPDESYGSDAPPKGFHLSIGSFAENIANRLSVLVNLVVHGSSFAPGQEPTPGFGACADIDFVTYKLPAQSPAQSPQGSQNTLKHPEESRFESWQESGRSLVV